MIAEKRGKSCMQKHNVLHQKLVHVLWFYWNHYGSCCIFRTTLFLSNTQWYNQENHSGYWVRVLVCWYALVIISMHKFRFLWQPSYTCTTFFFVIFKPYNLVKVVYILNNPSQITECRPWSELTWIVHKRKHITYLSV